MAKQRGPGFQKPAVGKAQPVGLAVLATQGFTISCSCGGFAKTHIRSKVREDAAERHVNKHHGGRAVWL
jgi:hypothetical protein